MRKTQSRQSSEKAARSRPEGQAREVFVILAMSVVSLTLGLALHLQLGVGGRAAAAAGTVIWCALLVFHLAIQRASSVVDLTSELTRLDDEIASLKRFSAVQPPAEPVLPGLPAARGRPAAPAQESRRPAPPRVETPERTAAAANRAADEPVHGRQPPNLPPPVLPEPARGAGDAKARIAAREPVQGRQPPNLPPPVLSEPARSDADAKAKVAAQQPAKQSAVQSPAQPIGWDLRPGQHREPPAGALKPAVFPPLNPAQRTREAAAGGSGQRNAPQPQAAVREPAPPQQAPERSAGGTAPTYDPAAAPASGAPAAESSGSMQNLIERLAKQLRAPASDAAANATLAPDDDPQQVIDRSVEALRAAGGSMRDSAGLAPEAPAAQTAAESPESAVAEAVTAQRLETYLESIINLADLRARHFEISLWLRTAGGRAMPPDVYAPLLAGGPLAAQLDAIKLWRIAKIADRLRSRSASALLFAGFQGQSLVDNAFLDAAAGIIAEPAASGRQMVLCFTQRDVRAFSQMHWETLTTMAEAGMRFAVGDLSDLAMDFAGLKSRGFDFARVDAAVLHDGMRGEGGIATGLDICQHLTGAGLGLMATRVDDDTQLARVRGLQVVFGQGAKFGGARPVRTDLGRGQEAAA